VSGLPLPETTPAFCTRCGTPLPAGSPFCTKCGAQQPVTQQAQPFQPAIGYAPQVRYAGFWLRFFAFVIDQVILGVAITPFTWGMVGSAMVMRGDPGDMPLMMGRIIRVTFISVVIKWLYYALMESSSKQATIGKLALGLKVTDLYLRPIDFGRASGRYFGKFLSGLTLLIGYIMAGFTARKQALHDMLAGTLVIRT
jgi:uncharacterized RDD family membrane protein YckC